MLGSCILVVNLQHAVLFSTFDYLHHNMHHTWGYLNPLPPLSSKQRPLAHTRFLFGKPHSAVQRLSILVIIFKLRHLPYVDIPYLKG